MKKFKKVFFAFLLLTLCFSMSSLASASVKISAKKITLTVGKSKTLKIKGTKKKVKWLSSKKSVATVNSKGKVTAKKKGTATITAKVGKKKYKCKVTVKSKKSAKNSEKPKNNTPSYKTYGENTYLVGYTIPSGQYALFTTRSDLMGYFEIDSDSTGRFSSIIANDNFYYNSIITVKSGQYLKLSRCKAVPIKYAKIEIATSGGMYRVGTDIKAGEYMLQSTSSTMGYYEVSSSDSHSFRDIITNDNFSGTAYVTVKDGEYLKLNRCKLHMYRPVN